MVPPSQLFQPSPKSADSFAAYDFTHSRSQRAGRPSGIGSPSPGPDRQFYRFLTVPAGGGTPSVPGLPQFERISGAFGLNLRVESPTRVKGRPPRPYKRTPPSGGDSGVQLLSDANQTGRPQRFDGRREALWQGKMDCAGAAGPVTRLFGTFTWDAGWWRSRQAPATQNGPKPIWLRLQPRARQARPATTG